mmetsp:Transcript_10487/g.32560  ORF Transcript_10487/g.32560 Transcript_10487/m.32560 type:complete len:213 (+) Transcript_10487:176-814(+)
MGRPHSKLARRSPRLAQRISVAMRTWPRSSPHPRGLKRQASCRHGRPGRVKTSRSAWAHFCSNMPAFTRRSRTTGARSVRKRKAQVVAKFAWGGSPPSTACELLTSRVLSRTERPGPPYFTSMRSFLSARLDASSARSMCTKRNHTGLASSMARSSASSVATAGSRSARARASFSRRRSTMSETIIPPATAPAAARITAIEARGGGCWRWGR